MLDGYWGGCLNAWMIGCLMNWNVPKDEEKRTLKYFRLALIKAGGIKQVDKETLQK
jgi:hypothetical protein